jgi:hypothetical protein
MKRRYSLKDFDPYDQKIQEVLEDFEFIPTRIDGIFDVEWGESNSPEKLNDGYSHCIQITFENEEECQNYLPHPEHETLKKKNTDILEKIAVFDYSI